MYLQIKMVMSFAMRMMGFGKPSVSVVRVHGMIRSGRGGGPLSSDGPVNLMRLGAPLKRAFEDKNARAVALVIDSPGGSPVQSSLLYERIRELKKKHGLPVHAFVEDVCASGGYYIAAASDDIFVDRSSVVGSIGVVRMGLGVADAANRLGVERRTQTAGKCKVQLDPFAKEQDPQDLARSQALLDDLHINFIDAVREGRGNRLDEEAAIEEARRVAGGDDGASWKPYEGAGLFDGSVHLGENAVKVGLADHVGTLHAVLEEKYGKDIQLRAYAPKRSFLGGGGGDGGKMNISGMLNTMAASVAEAAVEAAVYRAEAEASRAPYRLRI